MESSRWLGISNNRGKQVKHKVMKLVLSLAVAGILSGPPTVVAQVGIDKRADQILREMGELLGSAEAYSFRADISYDTFSAWGQEIQYEGVATLTVQRPDHLNVVFHGDNRQSRVSFDGKVLVFHDLFTNLYAKMEAPGKIDGAIDQLFEKYDESVPIADLLYADPYEALIGSSDFGVVVDSLTADEATRYHLAFSGEILDWQIWIEKGPRPVPSQLVITYKEEPGAPQYRASFSNWEFKPHLSENFFNFKPPAGAGEMEFLPVQSAPAQAEVQP
jgi:hypothetical protein